MRLEDVVAVSRLHRHTIRTVNSADYSPRAIAAWSKHKTAQRLRQRFLQEQRFVALIGTEIAGFVTISLDGKKLQALYVKKKFLGQGVGSALFKHAEHILRQHGVKRMEVRSTLTAKPFYLKQGMQTVKKTTDKVGGVRVPVYLLRKSI